MSNTYGYGGRGYRIPPQFVGVPRATLQQWLTQAQQALQDLTVGGKAEVVGYAQGDGTKNVTFTRAQVPLLQMRIQELVQALSGGHPTRRPPPVLYR